MSPECADRWDDNAGQACRDGEHLLHLFAAPPPPLQLHFQETLINLPAKLRFSEFIFKPFPGQGRNSSALSLYR